MVRRLHHFGTALVFTVLLITGCRPRNEVPDVGPQDPRWASILSRHTRGVISRRDPIRLVFTEDAVPEERVGQSAVEFLSAEPEIPGRVVFASRREIVLEPEGDLPPGRGFVVTLRRGDLAGIPQDLADYRFVVQVMEQDFEVSVVGLSPDPEHDSTLVLTGSVATADVEDAERIERVLQASLLGRGLVLSWEHAVDGRLHTFTVEGIRRGVQDQDLTLAWNGEPLGVEHQGTRTVTIPSMGSFIVTRIDAIRDTRQYIAARFTDAVDPRQNLSGLVGIEGAEFTTSIDGNEIRLYPSQAVAGQLTVTLEPGIRSADGKRLESRKAQMVTFAQNGPGVRFAGRGVILPEDDRLTIPIEAVNVNSVQVTAFRVYGSNMTEFLRNNPLSGGARMGSVGRYLWRRTLSLRSPVADTWTRYSLDLTDLMATYPGEMLRLAISINRSNSTYACTAEENAIPPMVEGTLRDQDDVGYFSADVWSDPEDFGYSSQINWQDRDDPCTDSYYRFSNQVTDARNFLASNIGMLAKRDQAGDVLVATTDLRTAESMSGAEVTFFDFQGQRIGSATTGRDGLARLHLDRIPFYAMAERNGDQGYLRMSASAPLATSHFDVGGTRLSGGLKGTIYGERGVWRPGDDLHLTLALQDETGQLPADHPATLVLSDPRGRRVLSVTDTDPVDGFYAFTARTQEEAPTGTWSATVEVGGAKFTKSLKIETVIPNRLRVDLDLGDDEHLQGGAPVHGELFAQWLTGATARNLRADLQVQLRSTTTSFDGFEGYSFDDPARTFSGEPQTLFDADLDGEGRAEFEATLAPGGQPPGFLAAGFTSRVFERGGAFSTSRSSATYSPYARYVGIRMPRGDRRGTLLTDSTHVVEVTTVDAGGTLVPVPRIEVTVYKIDWRWWWDRSGEALGQYATAQSRNVVQRAEVSTSNGRGTFPLSVAYPAWGRYLIRACDLGGGHCTGHVFYIDWPGWAGRPQADAAGGASVLTLQADREEYTVGDVARIELPPATQGRALVSIENGTRLLDQRWVEMREGRSQIEVPVTPEMSPTGYVSVTLVQPHEGRENDLPIRLYGIIPLSVTDPATRLNPVIQAPDEWRPETTATVRVTEAGRNRMTYTLAIVDEGLLGLTNFQTPELHDVFYQKEALGVSTWDLFDDVVGAYGAELERLLALGGSDAEELENAEPSRYPPMVRFLGPFTLEPGRTAEHAVDIPRYVGQVRVMVVAGHEGAYGSAARSVYVREPLSVLATLPRVVGPNEEITLPVSLFAMTEDVREATLRVETDGHFEVVGESTAAVTFQGLGEEMAFLRLRVGSELGFGQVRVEARSGQHTSRATIDLEVRSPNPSENRSLRQVIPAGGTWAPTVEAFGLPGTNRVTLELSSVPPLNLDERLHYLIRYPYGCAEQITSSAFPQMYLTDLLALDAQQRDSVQSHVDAAIMRLRGYQAPTGGFSYWPGGYGAGLSRQNAWTTNYVGHFLVEADRRGYYVPAEMISDWVDHQRGAAQSWTASDADGALEQAYRLYTLALAGRAEMGAMNRLRTAGASSYATAWYLAGAYGLAGMADVATQIARAAPVEPPPYREPGWHFASELRDRAVRLNTLSILGMRGEAEALARQISDALYSSRWYSTHALSWALVAMARHYADAGSGRPFTAELSRAGGDFITLRPSSAIYSSELAGIPDGASERIEVLNVGDGVLYGTVSVQGVPAAGDEQAQASGLSIVVQYLGPGGYPIEPARVQQGTDLTARVTVTNTTGRRIENLALEHRVPAGWEIHNPRMDALQGPPPTDFDYQDIRDDRVNTFFSLDAGKSRVFTTLINTAYLGTYYMPSVAVEAMYDGDVFARTAGRTVQVVESTR